MKRPSSRSSPIGWEKRKVKATQERGLMVLADETIATFPSHWHAIVP